MPYTTVINEIRNSQLIIRNIIYTNQIRILRLNNATDSIEQNLLTIKKKGLSINAMILFLFCVCANTWFIAYLNLASVRVEC